MTTTPSSPFPLPLASGFSRSPGTPPPLPPDLPALPLVTFSRLAFSSDAPHDVVHRLFTGLVVRIADIGGGFYQVGFLPVQEAAEESSIIIGAVAARDVRSLENDLGRSLAQSLDSGMEAEGIVSVTRYGNRSSLLWLRAPYHDQGLKKFALTGRECLPADQVAAMDKVAEQQAERRAAGLKLRKSWLLAEAKSKADVPGWLSRAALEHVLDSSSYRALPEAAESSAPSTAAKPARR